MNFKSMLLSSDDKIVRLLRRTLSDLDIGVEHCTSAETALHHLTRDRFEAIIVDCSVEGAADVLRAARTAPCNKRAVAVAILDPDAGLRSAFDVGAHFVLHKPFSGERAKSSFRAARALMKKERRHNLRVLVQFPVEMSGGENGVRFKVNSIDVGEGGVAVNLSRRSKPQGRWLLSFTLPGTSTVLEVAAEFAWEGTGAQVGLRFQNPAPEFVRQVGEWLSKNSPDGEKDDPPVRCQLTDLSVGGCYVEMPSPFPVSTRVTLSMRTAGAELRTEGVVRVMHADKGMGVEFTRTSQEHRALLEKFLGKLNENRNTLPELLVEPEGLETEAAQNARPAAGPFEADDPLLDLFRNQSTLPADTFMAAVRKLRGTGAAAAVASS